MSNTARRPALRWTSADYRPSGSCDSCDWMRPPGVYTRADAKSHARTHPGHGVSVDVIKRHVYWAESVFHR